MSRISKEYCKNSGNMWPQVIQASELSQVKNQFMTLLQGQHYHIAVCSDESQYSIYHSKCKATIIF